MPNSDVDTGAKPSMVAAVGLYAANASRAMVRMSFVMTTHYPQFV
jgi:hypothetical protein